jgi:hypothetical protein
MATASAINEMVASSASSRIAAAFSYRTVQIWDLRSAERIAELSPIMVLGQPLAYFCGALRASSRQVIILIFC